MSATTATGAITLTSPDRPAARTTTSSEVRASRTKSATVASTTASGRIS